MPLTLDRGEHSAQIVGRTPWSARVPLVPLFASEISIIHTAASRRGRRLRTGGSAPQSMQTARHWQSKWHCAKAPAPQKHTPLRPRVESPLPPSKRGVSAFFSQLLPVAAALRSTRLHPEPRPGSPLG